MSQAEQRHPTVERIYRWAGRLDRVPRVVRIALSLFITLELVALSWLVVSWLFGIEILDPDPETTIPLVIVVGLGLVFYGIGWWAVVGFDLDVEQPWRVEPPGVVYAAVGCAGLVVIGLLVVLGLVFGVTL